MDIIKKLAEELNIGRHQAEAAVKLIDEGNTIPFIARYRKEATGSLNDEVLRNLEERLKYLRNLEDRKSQVIASIGEQEKLTPELELKIKEAQTLVAVEDLYRPYKPKRRTRAMIAKEKGLEPLADLISMQMTAEPVEKAAAGFVSEEKGVASVQEAIQGARDILAERISDNAAFRTGGMLAVVDCTGKVLDTVVIYPTAPQNKVEESKKILKAFIKKYNISLISVGNGTASRESEQIIVDLLKEIREQVQYVIVNEAGASVYSASRLATEEFPAFDVGQRSAVSIARRLQDPLSELVKIDPKSIGVGQYQHDMNQKRLGEALEGVVEDCVNKVGVDLNTASASLLEYVSGINKTLAKNIVAYREENGAFKSRKQLLKVAKLGPKAFEQCAGFMRITGGENPLDGTSVHPESYDAAGKLLEKLGYKPEELSRGGLVGISRRIKDYKRTAQELGIGEITLRDIAGELEKPARDPRDEMPRPILRSDILEMKDLEPGMVLKGTVRNVIDFGAFVDIGVHQDGLVHISQMTDKYIKHPLEAVSVGDVVDVKILSVDLAKKRISLTMKGVK